MISSLHRPTVAKVNLNAIKDNIKQVQALTECVTRKHIPSFFVYNTKSLILQ